VGGAYFGINAIYGRLSKNAICGLVIEELLRIPPAARPAGPLWINEINRLRKRNNVIEKPMKFYRNFARYTAFDFL
jgi:hypothetical protein